MTQKVDIRYRTWFKGAAPQPIKLQVPGWAGERNYETGQPWHCKPFVDGATYGLELIYPYETTVTVTNENGRVEFHADSLKEWETTGVGMPFKSFAENHFGYTSALDIKTKTGYGVMILPHPRFYTDMTGTCPVPSIGLIESDWWPKIFFIAFKSPLPGQTYIFSKGEGVAQFLIVPKQIKYNVTKMSPEEEAERGEQEKALSKYGKSIATKSWTDKNNGTFDNKYRVLSTMNHKEEGSVSNMLNNMKQKMIADEKMGQTIRQDRLTRRLIRPEKNNANRT